MKKIFLIIAFFLPVLSLVAQTEVLPGITRGKDYGVVYTLPKTEILIEVKANKVTYTPGEFSRYADRYLRLNDVSGDPEEYWELISISAKSIGVPDNSNTYFIKLKDKTVAPLIELTPDGLLKSINVPYSERVQAGNPTTPATPARRLEPKDFLTEEILMASSTAKMAELTSKEIYNIRESRNALLRGQADYMPQDGEQLKLMLDNLEAQENAMIELFAGIRNTEERTFTIRLTPEKTLNNEVIFRFSRKLGILGKDDLAGEAVYLSLIDQKSVNIPDDTDSKKKKLEGVAYNVPGKARVTITDGKKTFFEGDLSVTQFGTTEYLASELFNKNSTVKVTFNPETGGVIKVDRE